jgi:signal transduction histidine kinase
VVVCDKDGKFLLFNSAAEKIMGIGLTEVPPNGWSAHYGCYLPDGTTLCPTGRLPLVRAMRGEVVDEAEFIIRNEQRPMGVWVSINARPLLLKHQGGETAGGVVVLRDITERKRAEKRLQYTNELLVEQQTQLLDALMKVKKTNHELQETQLQLIQAAKMESVGRLAAGVAHEVKNPLATLLIGIDHLADHFPQQDDQADISGLLHDMGQAVRRADSVIRGLLDFSSPMALQMNEENLNDVIDQSLHLVKHELDRHHITVMKELEPMLPDIKLDRTKMEQVFVNLFMNSIQAMPGGGSLRVATLFRPNTAGSNGDAGGEIAAHIEDTGTGVARLRSVLYHQAHRAGHRSWADGHQKDHRAAWGHHRRRQPQAERRAGDRALCRAERRWGQWPRVAFCSWMMK